jgi:RNA polymerase sigma-70 factor (ECF subfamily)
VAVSPQTRETLIRRLPNTADAEAWDQFIEIYEPLLFRLARAKGFQEADAQDFVQEVLSSVAKAIGRWVDDASRGSFRAWLFRIAQNLSINFLSRARHARWGSGDSQVARLLEQAPQSGGDSASLYVQEYRRELFRCAAERVRDQVSLKQWLAFWQTSVEGRAIEEVATELQMTVGAIYIARSRIAKRIREKISEYEEGQT